MNIVCLCPTYNHPQLLRNALACFLAQDYPAEKRCLIIVDDAGQFEKHYGDCCIYPTELRFDSLPAKYDWMVEYFPPCTGWADAFVVWDDDDVYLPWHISAHVKALESNLWSHPKQILSTYTGRPEIESAAGRFHGSLAMRREALQQVGGWLGVVPKDRPRVADFDQRMIASLGRLGPPGRPDADHSPSYVYRWGSTNADHCSARMKTPDDETWYESAPTPQRFNEPLILTPEMDKETKWLYENIRNRATVPA